MIIEEISAKYRRFIEEYLEKWLAQFHDEPQKPLYDAMAYSLLLSLPTCVGSRYRHLYN